MAGLDYTYYRDSFGGELTEAEFERFYSTARDIVGFIVGFDVSEAEDAATLRALCLQTDYTADSRRGGSGLRSETLGDYSVSYTGEGNIACLYGNEVCPEALIALVGCGLLTRWA